jgi:hypothetical protein
MNFRKANENSMEERTTTGSESNEKILEIEP